MFHFAVIWLVTTISLLILARLPLGLEINGVSTAALAAFLLSVLDAFLRPTLLHFFGSFQGLTVGLISIGLNSLIFGMTSTILEDFRLNAGFVSALINPIALSLLNTWLLRFIH